MLTNVATLNINRFEFVNVIISSGDDDAGNGRMAAAAAAVAAVTMPSHSNEMKC